MGGLSFLLKKGWHPNTNENKKAVYIAEQSALLRHSLEQQAASEVRKERELQRYECSGDMQRRDPREAALKFMYAMPQPHSHSHSHSGSGSGNIGGVSECSSSGGPLHHYHEDEQHSQQHSLTHSQRQCEPARAGVYLEQVGEEDSDVKQFREKWIRKQNKSSSSSSSGGGDSTGVDDTVSVSVSVREGEGGRGSDRDAAEAFVSERVREQQQQRLKRQPGFGQSSQYSTLEGAVGRKRRLGLTQDEQAARHPSLKNAPVEGAYAREVELHHKPFAQVLRNVQCFRCGEWGHASGDRECPQAGHNPHDWERQQREDPLTFMKRSTQHLQSKETLVLKRTALPSEVRLSMSSTANTPQLMEPTSQEEKKEEVQDSDAVFLASLSSKEKIRLLKRLEEIESSGDKSSFYALRLQERGLAGLRDCRSASSDSDSDSSSSSDSDTNKRKRKHDHDRKKYHRRKKKEKGKEKKKERKSKKRKHKHDRKKKE